MGSKMKTRRDFMKSLGVAASTLVSLPHILKAENEIAPKKESGDKKEMVFLFQGDSITDGNRTRDYDWNHVMGHGYAYLIASRLWFDYPQQGLMFYNRGISGNRVSDLVARWQTDTLDLNPDVLSILIGVNDTMAVVKNWAPDPIEKFEADYRKILDQTLEQKPETLIILCEPFILPLGWVEENPELWQTELKKRQEVTRRIVADYKTLFLPLQQIFNDACKIAPANYWIWDGVHPMPAGHELIAREWIKVVGKKLSFLKR